MTSGTDRRRGVTGGAAFKLPCRAATTANITLSGLQTIDGVSLAQDDRVLVKNQSTASQNGIYVADSGDWSRATDFNGSRDAVQGTLVLVVSGTVSASTVYQLTTASPTIGTTSLTFAVTGTPALAYASAFIQTLLDDTTAAAARTTLGVPAATDIIPLTLTTAGDILSHNGSAYIRTPRGTTSQYLGVTGTALAWKDLIIDLATSQVTGVLPRANGGFTPAQVTNSLGANVLLNNTANYFDGPSLSLAAGTWWLSGTITLGGGAAGELYHAKLWDGTNVVASALTYGTTTGSGITSVSLSGPITLAGTTTVKISARDSTSTSGAMLYNASGNSKDCTLSAFRIA